MEAVRAQVLAAFALELLVLGSGLGRVRRGGGLVRGLGDVVLTSGDVTRGLLQLRVAHLREDHLFLAVAVVLTRVQELGQLAAAGLLGAQHGVGHHFLQAAAGTHGDLQGLASR